MQSLEDKRDNDQKLVEKIQADLYTLVDQAVGEMKMRLNAQYETTNGVLQAKLQLLTEDLDQVDDLEQSLHQFKSFISQMSA